MPRQFAISDIHGCNKTFEAMLDHLAFSKGDTLYLLGDYVDRGPDSKGVIDTIWRMQEAGYTVHCLMGNHEEMTCSSYDLERQRPMTNLGEPNLLKSFGVDHLSGIPVEYIDWMRNLDRYLEIPGYILVHAGLNFNYPDPLDRPVEMIWIRSWYGSIDREWLGERLIIHGHTPVPVARAKAMAQEYDLLPVQDIDCGAVFRQSGQFGYLCAFDLSNRNLIFQENTEDT
jgi:serine/threonine protein phosphatase 1